MRIRWNRFIKTLKRSETSRNNFFNFPFHCIDRMGGQYSWHIGRLLTLSPRKKTSIQVEKKKKGGAKKGGLHLSNALTPVLVLQHESWVPRKGGKGRKLKQNRPREKKPPKWSMRNKGHRKTREKNRTHGGADFANTSNQS